ncbi:unnamed protein product, partial [marine sediment metagenome]
SDHSPDEDKPELLVNMYLSNYFSSRLFRDPGFFSYVLKEIENNKELIKNVVQYTKQVIENYDGNTEDIFPVFSRDFSKSENDFDEKDILSDKFFSENQLELISQVPELEFLKKRFQLSLEGNNSVEMRAVALLLFNFFEPNLPIDRLLIPISPYKGSSNTNYWITTTNKFLFEKIENKTLYIGVFPQNFSILRLLPIILNSKFQEEIKSILTRQDILSEKILSDEIMVYSYVTNAILLCCVIWFDKLSKEEKVEVLNSYYYFQLEKEKLETVINEIGSRNLYGIAHSLFK